MCCSGWSDFIKSMFYINMEMPILQKANFNTQQSTGRRGNNLFPFFHGKALPLILEIAQEFFFFPTTPLCRVPAGFHQKLVILSGPGTLQYYYYHYYYYYYYYYYYGQYSGPTCFWNKGTRPNIGREPDHGKQTRLIFRLIGIGTDL